jgi:hypothetical protein
LARYVTKFSVDDSHLAHYEPHQVGSAIHVEYWIPAEQLSGFNAAIRGMISVESAYFGMGSKGFVPDEFGLKTKDAVAQFIAMAKTWNCRRMDFVREVSINRKAVYLNFLFWSQFDFTALGVNPLQRNGIIERLREAWDFNHMTYRCRSSRRFPTIVNPTVRHSQLLTVWIDFPR